MIKAFFAVTIVAIWRGMIHLLIAGVVALIVLSAIVAHALSDSDETTDETTDRWG